jgi:shikimate kinase
MMIALESGIEGVTLSGTGPAYVAMGDSSVLDKVAKAWEKGGTGGKLIRTKINNEGAI